MSRPSTLALRGSIASFLALCACAGAPRPERGTGEAPRVLFDGRSLAGWEGDPRLWRVENGALVGEVPEGVPRDASRYLVWREGETGDFELELDWRARAVAPEQDPGLELRARLAATGTVVGYGVALADEERAGGIRIRSADGASAGPGERSVHDGGGQAVESFADPETLLGRLASGSWNHLRVVAFGPRLTVEVNGALFAETIDLDPEAARRGLLALGLGPGTGQRLEVRGIRLRTLAAPAPAIADAEPGAQRMRWIGPAGPPTDGCATWFLRSFALDEACRDAELWIVADARFEVWLDGTRVLEGSEALEPLRVELGARLVPGEHELVVRVESPSATTALELRASGVRDPFVLVSDGAFQSAVQSDAEPARSPTLPERLARLRFGPARARGALGVPGEARLVQSLAPEVPAIQLPAGFSGARLCSLAPAAEGPWGALAFDSAGRLYVSDPGGQLFVVEPAAAAGGETRVRPLELPLGEASGLVWAFDALYAVVRGPGRTASGLYRARDTDGDGALDEVRCLRAFPGAGAAGPSGIALDPEGHGLVLVGGREAPLPGPFQRSALSPRLGEDAALPALAGGDGAAQVSGGWIARTDPEGKVWELLAAGLDDARDLAFSAEGELFTCDAGPASVQGLPWFRPMRILHAVGGADFGWRAGGASWPADSYDSLPAALELGPGASDGIVFGTQTGFPAPWKQALFVCDAAAGRIHSVFLEPKGASYRGRSEVFASGAAFPVLDAAVGADGALYLLAGGPRTPSGLYRVTWAGSAAEERAPIADPGADARARRRALERLGRAGLPENGSAAPSGLQGWDELGDPDPFLRHAARVALEHQDPALWSAKALDEPVGRRALEALLAWVHCAAPGTDAAPVLARALECFESGVERRDALRLATLAVLRLQSSEDSLARLRSVVDGVYPSGDPGLDRGLLALGVRLGVHVAGRALDALERAPSAEERIAILDALRASGRTLDADETQRTLAALERERASDAGPGVRQALERMRAELGERLGSAESGASAVRPASASAEPEAFAADWPPPTRELHAWTLAELEPRLEGLARGRDFARGRAAFHATRCVQCHRFAGEGTRLGPDLASAVEHEPARVLLQAILEPSRAIAEEWRETEFLAGEQILARGRLESEGAQELVVRQASGTSVRIPAHEVSARRPSELSAMPAGLLDVLEPDEILDLLAYLVSGGRPEDGRFR